jgi:hypothetical protein
VVFEVSV